MISANLADTEMHSAEWTFCRASILNGFGVYSGGTVKTHYMSTREQHDGIMVDLPAYWALDLVKLIAGHIVLASTY